MAGDGKIRAPMDGAVVNILVNKGDQVIKGQTLLVLEAMKIQQQIKSDVDGVIEDVLGQQGQQVKTADVIYYSNLVKIPLYMSGILLNQES